MLTLLELAHMLDATRLVGCEGVVGFGRRVCV